MERRAHWDAIYAAKGVTELSWYQSRPTASLDLIRSVAAPPDARIIDVGGGASTLVDHLLDGGYERLTILDISGPALEEARRRLGPSAAERVRWVEGDVTSAALPAAGYDVWHDRAVFHFLLDAADRARYVAQLERSVATGGHAVIATFADDGPTRCSGLEVRRYSPDTLAAEIGPGFELTAERRETHRTPAGAEQRFAFTLLRRR